MEKKKNVAKKVGIVVASSGLIVSSVLNTATPVMAAYNKTDAVNYAKKYASKCNSYYPSYKSDCTNYVSQCLSNGGIALRPMYGKQIQIQDIDSVKVTDVQYFFCGEYTRSDTSGVLTKTGFVSSSTWSCVDSQNYNYSAGCFKMGLVQELSSRRATITCYSLKSDSDKKKFTRTVKVGDVVQFRRKGKKAYSHSAIVGKVTSRNSTSKNVYFYSHSSTRTASANDNFWTMIGQGDLSAYDEIKIIHLGNSFK